MNEGIARGGHRGIIAALISLTRVVQVANNTQQPSGRFRAAV